MKSLWYDKYFATAHPSTTKRNIVNIKQVSLYDLALYQYVICINFHQIEKNFFLKNIKKRFTICAIPGYFSR